MSILHNWLGRLTLALLAASLLALSLFVIPGTAQESDPWRTVQLIQQQLFEAQKALVAGDAEQAQKTLLSARQSFEDGPLALQLSTAVPGLDTGILQHFDDALVAVSGENLPGLAMRDSQIWTLILLGSYTLTLDAIQNGDVPSAAQWLQVREYRPPTRFSRASANATLALVNLSAGQIEKEAAFAQVRADLLDTYQSNLSTSLATIREGLDLGIEFRSSAATGEVYGYWQIIGQEYAAQFGEEAHEDASLLFDELLAAVEVGRETAILKSVSAIEELVSSFRAAPLTEDEQARRAGQMMRFLALVPIEYGRGVKNGEVFLDIELQEAITFLAGANAAFLDLRTNLDQIDHAKAERIESGLQTAKGYLDAANRREEIVELEVIEESISAITEEFASMLPEEWTQGNTASDLDVIATVLDQVESAVAQGQYPQAESARLEAYALFDLALEPRLLAFAPDLVAKIDGLFWQGFQGQAGLGQAINTEDSLKNVRLIRSLIDEALVEAQQVLGDGASAPAVVVTNAAIIVFREGLEAVVIIAALVAGMAKSGDAHLRRPLVVGAVLALLATVLTWLLAQRVLVNFVAYGERLEAVVSIIAIIVLLMVTNWFFHKSYWTDWLASFHQIKNRLVQGEAGQMLGLVALGFSSIYREGFETVLFLQALVLDAGSLIVFQGVALGLVGVAIVGYLIFRLQKRLPYMKLFVITAFLIGGVLLILVGKTVHVMQAVAWLPVTPIVGLDVPYWMGLWFGVYATWESVVAQLLAFLFVIGSYYLAEFMRKRVRLRSAKQSSTP